MDYTDPVEVAKQLLAEEQEVVNEAETILDLDDEQDTQGKKPKVDTDKGTEGKAAKNQGTVKMKPSDANAKVEKPAMTKEHLDALFSGEDLSEDFQEKLSRPSLKPRSMSVPTLLRLNSLKHTRLLSPRQSRNFSKRSPSDLTTISDMSLRTG